MVMKAIVFFLLLFSFGNRELPKASSSFWSESVNKINIQKIKIESNKDELPSLWMSNNFLGFIGLDFQRFYIHIDSVSIGKKENELYNVYGKTKVGDNICNFTGIFRITETYIYDRDERELKYKEAESHNDAEVMERYKYDKGFIVGEYNLSENPNQKGSGIFKGIFITNFYIKGGIVKYDNLDFGYSDEFKNNQFVGIWESYNTKKEKPCNWGEHRIPYSGDLDIGVGEFSPNKKYLGNGWKTYYQAYYYDDALAIKEEKSEWWK